MPGVPAGFLQGSSLVCIFTEVFLQALEKGIEARSTGWIRPIVCILQSRDVTAEGGTAWYFSLLSPPLCIAAFGATVEN